MYTIQTFKRCFPRGGLSSPYVVGRIFSSEVTFNSLTKSPVPEWATVIKHLKDKGQGAANTFSYIRKQRIPSLFFCWWPVLQQLCVFMISYHPLSFRKLWIDLKGRKVSKQVFSNSKSYEIFCKKKLTKFRQHCVNSVRTDMHGWLVNMLAPEGIHHKWWDWSFWIQQRYADSQRMDKGRLWLWIFKGMTKYPWNKAACKGSWATYSVKIKIIRKESQRKKSFQEKYQLESYRPWAR